MVKTPGADSSDFPRFKPAILRGREGFARVGQNERGQWWLIDAAGRPFFMKAVAAVNRHGRAGPAPIHPGAYARALDPSRPDNAEDFAGSASRRLSSWGMNTLGPWADPRLADAGFAATTVADFLGAGVPVIRGHGVHLPDVFDPGWGSSCDARAAQAAETRRGRTDFIGYFTDDAPGWGEVRPDRPSLLQVCLSLEPAFPAYHAAWEFALAPHGGELAALGREWGVDLPNRETVRQRTLAEKPLGTPGYLRDHDLFSREFAQRYFSTTAEALRRHDPDHLVLGCRFAAPPGPGVLAACAYPRVDALSWQCHGSDFAAQIAAYAGTGMPLLLAGCGLSNERFRSARFVPHAGPTRAERMLRELRRMLTAACAHPSVVGYEWARWADEPDEIPPFGAGLVHVDDREAAEHIELLAQINARAERLRLKKPRR